MFFLMIMILNYGIQCCKKSGNKYPNISNSRKIVYI